MRDEVHIIDVAAHPGLPSVDSCLVKQSREVAEVK
jgi:hypothetical protein